MRILLATAVALFAGLMMTRVFKYLHLKLPDVTAFLIAGVAVGPFAIGRLGIPYRAKGVNIICVAIDAPGDSINALAGALGRIEGINAKATYSNV